MLIGIQRSAAPFNGTTTIARAASVTLALALLGAVIQSVVAPGLLVATLMALNGPSIVPLVDGFLAAVAAMGAAFGAVSLPLAAWALPTVAVWRVAAVTSLGTTIGGILGFATIDGLLGLILGAGIGFVYAASWLAMRSRPPEMRKEYQAD